jgi:hypothetical protein
MVYLKESIVWLFFYAEIEAYVPVKTRTWVWGLLCVESG